MTVNVTKTWLNDTDAERPDSITFYLYRNGSNTGKHVTMYKYNDWHQVHFTELEKYDSSGNEYVYSVREGDTSSTMSGNNGAVYTKGSPVYTVDGNTTNTSFANTRTGATVTLTFTKYMSPQITPKGAYTDDDIWIYYEIWDKTNEVRKGSYQMNFWTTEDYRLGRTATHSGFEKYDQYGREIQYEVRETKVTLYTNTDIDVTDSYTLGEPVLVNTTKTTITNIKKPDNTSLVYNVTKVWQDNENVDGDRPQSITVLLKQNGTVIASKTITAADDWIAQFTGLPKVNPSTGRDYTYTIEEATLPGYNGSTRNGPSTNTTKNVTLTNKQKTIAINVTKVWKEDVESSRPESITVYLKRNGETYKTVTVTPDSSGNWLASFTALPEYDSGGNKYQYDIEEAPMPGYSNEINWEYKNNTTNTTITNTQTETVKLSVKKVWKDSNDKAKKRPASIKVTLTANGEDYKTVTLSEENSWFYQFIGLPKYDKEGKRIRYDFKEVDVPSGYKVTKSTEGSTRIITNTYKDSGGGGKKGGSYNIPLTGIDIFVEDE